MDKQMEEEMEATVHRDCMGDIEGYIVPIPLPSNGKEHE